MGRNAAHKPSCGEECGCCACSPECLRPVHHPPPSSSSLLSMCLLAQPVAPRIVSVAAGGTPHSPNPKQTPVSGEWVAAPGAMVNTRRTIGTNPCYARPRGNGSKPFLAQLLQVGPSLTLSLPLVFAALFLGSGEVRLQAEIDLNRGNKIRGRSLEYK